MRPPSEASGNLLHPLPGTDPLPALAAALDAQFVNWLMDHQREAGVFTTVADLVQQLTDNAAARVTTDEILARVRQTQAQPS